MPAQEVILLSQPDGTGLPPRWIRVKAETSAATRCGTIEAAFFRRRGAGSDCWVRAAALSRNADGSGSAAFLGASSLTARFLATLLRKPLLAVGELRDGFLTAFLCV